LKSKLEIYALAVCFAAVICLVISISIAGYSTITIINPELTIESYEFDKYQSNDNYWESKKSCYSRDQSKMTRPPEEELTKQRLEELSIKLKGERRNGLQSLIYSLIFVVVGAVTLLIHWRIAKNART
jgi:hypothetical protein